MAFKVTIDFKRGCSLALEIHAKDAATAEKAARVEAVSYGFKNPIKKVTVREA
jgi:hypothetical protein